MPSFNHVNLMVSPDDVEAQEAFLVDVLGYRRVEVEASLKARGARWFEAEDGSQVHLSQTPHVAVDYGAQLADVEDRLEKAGFEVTKGGLPGLTQTVFCVDPAGNRWELRGFASES